MKQSTSSSARSGNATPSFAGLSPASDASSAAKRANRSVDTTAEVLLRSALWRLGLRFRKNYRTLPGKPDIVFPAVRIAVFCDGDFWHGRRWRSLKAKLVRGSNGSYWVAKIRANRRRDRANTRRLEHEGWHVIRIWETDILANIEATARHIYDEVESRRPRQSKVSKARSWGR